MNLPRGDTIVIELAFSGCSGTSLETVSYAREPKPRVSSIDGKAAVELTADQVARVDALLSYYRKHRGWNGCTRLDEITLIQRRAGRELRREHYVDGDCQTDLLDATPELLRQLGLPHGPVLPITRILDALHATARTGGGVGRIPPPDPEGSRARDELKLRELKAESARLVKVLAGYEVLRREFIIEDAELGDFSGARYSLFVQLRAARPRLVDAAWWWNPTTHGRQERDWHDFLRVHQAVERMVAQHRWLEEWKRAASDRHIEAHIVGVRSYGESDLESQIVPVWRHAGLKGKPSYEVLLRRGAEWAATIFFGDEEPRALVTWSRTGQGGHWLDAVDLQGGPEYVIVARDGTWTKRSTRTPGK